MTRRYKPVDLSALHTRSIAQRSHKENIAKMAGLPEPGASACGLLQSLPATLGAGAFRKVVRSILEARRHDRPVVVAFGAHVIKVGCGQILVDLIRRGIVNAVACNGACAIHDVELALLGETSEEVAGTIRDGSFGMVRETFEFFEAAVELANRQSLGLGHAVGRLLWERDARHKDRSVFAAAVEASIPACVHVALGTDTVHMSAGMNGEATGAASMHDFRVICDVVSDLGAVDGSDVGGVWLNVGSAVVMPEVFLKAVSVARNLGANLDAMTTANLDMNRHYRPFANVVSRPVSPGHGFEIIGHHEIMLPLLRQAILDECF